MSRLLVVGVFALGFLAVSRGGQDGKKHSPRELMAKKVAEDFMKALWGQQLEDVVKTVDVPFCWDGRENLKDRKTLEQRLDRLVRRDRSQTKYTFKAIHEFATLPQEALRNDQRKLLQSVLTKDDYIVLFELSVTDDTPAIMVRIRDQKAKVVGFDG